MGSEPQLTYLSCLTYYPLMALTSPRQSFIFLFLFLFNHMRALSEVALHPLDHRSCPILSL